MGINDEAHVDALPKPGTPGCVIDGHRCSGTRHQCQVHRTVGVGSVDARAAEEEAEHIVVLGAHIRDIPPSQRRIGSSMNPRGNEIEFQYRHAALN